MEDWGVVWSPPFKLALVIVALSFIGLLALM